MNHEFWATEYTKLAGLGGRMVGGALNPLGAVSANRGFHSTLDASDLTPEEQARAEEEAGLGAGLRMTGRGMVRGGLESMGGGLAGGAIGAGLGAGIGRLTGNTGAGAAIGGMGGALLGSNAGALHGIWRSGQNTGTDVANEGIQRALAARG